MHINLVAMYICLWYVQNVSVIWHKSVTMPNGNMTHLSDVLYTVLWKLKKPRNATISPVIKDCMSKSLEY